MNQPNQAGMATPTPQTNVDRDAQTKAQKELLDRIHGNRDEHVQLTAALQTDTKLTTKEHVGKGKEPHKDDEMEARKVGSAQNAVSLKSVAISSHESGEPTDVVVTEPSTLSATPHPLMHRDDAFGTASVIHEAKGGEKKGAHARVVGAGPEIVGKGPEVKTEKLTKTTAEQMDENWSEGDKADKNKAAKGKKH